MTGFFGGAGAGAVAVEGEEEDAEEDSGRVLPSFSGDLATRGSFFSSPGMLGSRRMLGRRDALPKGSG